MSNPPIDIVETHKPGLFIRNLSKVRAALVPCEAASQSRAEEAAGETGWRYRSRAWVAGLWVIAVGNEIGIDIDADSDSDSGIKRHHLYFKNKF